MLSREAKELSTFDIQRKFGGKKVKKRPRKIWLRNVVGDMNNLESRLGEERRKIEMNSQKFLSRL